MLLKQLIFAILAPQEATSGMQALKTILFLLVFSVSLSAQTYTQRLAPQVSASETEVCANDEVEVSLSYNTPNNTSILLNGIDEFVNIPADPVFDFGGSTNFTIEFYVKSSSVTGVLETVISKGDLSGAGFAIGLFGGVVSVNLSDGTNAVNVNGFTNIADGAWHHVAVVADRANSATIYIDGFYDNDGAISSVGSINSVELLRVGATVNAGAPVAFYNGYVDEVRVWTGLLTIAEILSRSSIHINPSAVSNLIGYWDMNEVAGPQLIDCSPTGATGTMSGSVSLAIDAPILTWTFNPIWSNGQTGTTTIFVNPLDTTQYKVEIGYCKYLSADSVTVNVIPCEDIDETGLISSVWIPNAFTPNNDFKNDVFLVQASNITYYEIMIFNRWGNIIYHSKNILNGWDGTFEGDRVKDDVYTVLITYRDRFEVEHKKYGTVTVMH